MCPLNMWETHVFLLKKHVRSTCYFLTCQGTYVNFICELYEISYKPFPTNWFVENFYPFPNWLRSDSQSKFGSQLLLAIEFFNIIFFLWNLFPPSLSSHLFIVPISLSLSLLVCIYRSSLRFSSGPPTSYLAPWIPKKEGPLPLFFIS
jgi:hypothetical protein